MPREHPLCQFGLLILFLQTFEESTPGYDPAAAAPPIFVFRFSSFEFEFWNDHLVLLHSFPGGSGAPPTCKWLKSCSVALSSSLIPRVKFGSLKRRLRADSGIFCSTPSFC